MYAMVLCVAACHAVASCCTVDAILYISVLCCHVPYSCPCCTLSMPWCYVLPHAMQLLHVVQLMPFCISVFCVATCRTVAHVATMYATVLCVASTTVYATVLSVAACHTVAHVVQLVPFCMPVFCVTTCCTVVHSCCYCVCHSVMC